MLPDPVGASVGPISMDPQFFPRPAGLQGRITIMVVRASTRGAGQQRCSVGSSHAIWPGVYRGRGREASRASCMASITGDKSGATCWAELVSVSGSAERYASP